jgi:hypothetical protein
MGRRTYVRKLAAHTGMTKVVLHNQTKLARSQTMSDTNLLIASDVVAAAEEVPGTNRRSVALRYAHGGVRQRGDGHGEPTQLRSIHAGCGLLYERMLCTVCTSF